MFNGKKSIAPQYETLMYRGPLGHQHQHHTIHTIRDIWRTLGWSPIFLKVPADINNNIFNVDKGKIIHELLAQMENHQAALNAGMHDPLA